MSRSFKASTQSVIVTLLPIMASVLVGFLVIGAALPVLPLHVHQDLGFSTFVVGLVAGAQFVAAIVSRIWAGSLADAKSGRRAVAVGLVAAAASGLLYLLSLQFQGSPILSVAILLVGRAVLGAAESFIITGGIAWGLAAAAPEHAGKVIAWVGTAMFAAFAAGGPLGTMLFTAYGFAAIALLTFLLPLSVLFFLWRGPSPIRPSVRANGSVRKVVASVWLPGLALAFSSIGYGAILTFSSLLYAQQGWQPLWLAFTAFGVALIVARLVFGHLPDRVGGAKSALICMFIQATGLALIWFARDVVVASAGAAVAGFGYSLIFPGLGVEAVRKVVPENRGMVMAVYTVFLDVAMAAGSPLLGWAADYYGLASVFVVGAGVTLFAAAITLRLCLALRREICPKSSIRGPMGQRPALDQRRSPPGPDNKRC